MTILMLIFVLTGAMWYIIDRFKELTGWSKLKYGNYVTMAVSAAFAILLVLSFSLDLIFALGWWTEVTFAGLLITILVMMGGTSLLDKIMSLASAKKAEAKAVVSQDVTDNK